jgi:hypothetical protein
MDLTTQGRAAQGTSSNVSGTAGEDLTTQGRAAQGTSPNVPGTAGVDTTTESRAAQGTPSNVSGPSSSGLYWMPDPPQAAAAAQSTGKEEEQGALVRDPSATSGKKIEEGRSGKDLQDASAKFWTEKTKTPLNRTGEGAKAEAAATAEVKGAPLKGAAEARNNSGSGKTANNSSMDATALQRLRARVARSGREALDVGGGGQCQYMSFAHQIRTRFPHLSEGAANMTWQQICSLLADWLSLNRWHAGGDTSESLSIEDGGKGDWEDYVSKVRGGLVWGNELTAIAMVHVFQTPIRIWTSRAGAGVEWNGYYPDGHDSTRHGTAIEVGHVVENHYLSVIKRENVPAAAKHQPVSGSGAPYNPVQPKPQPLQDSRLVLHGLLLKLRKRLAVRPASTGAVDPETIRELLVLVPSLLDSTALEFYGPALAFAQEMQRLAAEAGVQTEKLWEKIVQGKSVPASRLDLAEDAAVRDKNNRENQVILNRNQQRWRDNEATARDLRELGGLFPRRVRGGTRGMNASSWTHGKSAFRGATTKPHHSAPGYE